MKRDIRPDEKGKVKFRVIEFELEGSDTSLQESLRSLANALSRGGIGPKTISVQPPKALAHRVEQTGSDTDHSDQDDDGQEQAAPLEDNGESPPDQESRKSRPPPPKPKFLDTLRFDGPPPLDKYLESNGNPDETKKIYLVIAQWFKEVAKIEEISKDHIYTAYKFLRRSPPDDVAQPLRDGKKAGWFTKGSKNGTFVVHHIGERIIHELQK